MSDPEAARRLFKHARREALVVTAVWAVLLVWTVAVCYLLGYPHEPGTLVVDLGLVAEAAVRKPDIILGFPDWVFYGIMLPWLAASAFTVWFGLKGIADDDLGAEAAEQGGHGHGH